MKHLSTLRRWGLLIIIWSLIVGTCYAQPNLSLRLLRVDTASCGLNVSKSVTIRVRNTGTAEATNLSVNYRVNPSSTATVVEVIPTVGAGDSVTYTFTQGFTPTSVGLRQFTAFISDAAGTHTDDTLRVVRYFNSPIAGMPQVNYFDADNGNFWEGSLPGATPAFRWGRPSGSLINRAQSGTNAWYTSTGTDTVGILRGRVSMLYTPCYDFTGVTDPRLAMNLWLNLTPNRDGLQVQYTTNQGVTWVTLGSVQGGWYNGSTNVGLASQVVPSRITSAGFTGNTTTYNTYQITMPFLANRPSVGFRFVLGSENAPANGTRGFAVDNFRVFNQGLPDFSVAGNLIGFPPNGCGASPIYPVTVRIRNIGTTGGNLTAYYRFNNNPVVSELVPVASIPTGDTVRFTFSQSINTLNSPDTIRVWVSGEHDFNPANDSTTRTVFSLRETVSGFPYRQSFEAGNGGWTTESISPNGFNTWALGRPNKTHIRGAASGNNAFVTGGLGSETYVNNERSVLASPCFDLSSLNNPVFKCKIWWESEAQLDGTVLQFSTNLGVSWTNVGRTATLLPDRTYNWTNASTVTALGTNGWTGTSANIGSRGWVEAVQAIPALANRANVRFRFLFAANGSITSDGVGIDDIRIEEQAPNVAVTALRAPSLVCGGTTAQSLRVIFTNPNKAVFNQAVQGTVTVVGPSGQEVLPFNGSINPGIDGGIDSLTLTSVLNTTAEGLYNITVSLNGGDGFAGDDTLRTTLSTSRVVNSFPYVERFETGANGWSAIGANDNWNIGRPNKAGVTNAYDGNNAVVAGALNGDYNNYARLQFVSPCFDLTAQANPVLEFYAFWETFSEDGASLQFTTNGGQTWQDLGRFGDANWFNNGNIAGLNQGGLSTSFDGWSGITFNASGGWRKYSRDLSALSTQSSVRFRFTFGSDAINQRGGFGFDQFVIKARATYNPAIANIITPQSTCEGATNAIIRGVVRNVASQAIRSYGVRLRINGVVIDSINTTRDSLRANLTDTLTFAVRPNFTAVGNYDIRVELISTRDDDTADSYFRTRVITAPVRNTFPAVSGFETGRENWTTRTQTISPAWSYGTPAIPIVTTPNTGNGFFIGMQDSAGYPGSLAAVLESPCYDLTNITSPYISFDAIWNLDASGDGVALQYSTNNGVTWLTSVGNPAATNWSTTAVSTLNNPFGASRAWVRSSPGYATRNYTRATNYLPSSLGGLSQVKFRFVFWSDNNSNSPTLPGGFALSSFTVRNKPDRDIEVVRFLDLVSSCNPTYDSVRVVVANKLSAPQSGYKALIFVNGNAVDTAYSRRAMPLDSGMLDTLVMTSPVSFPANGTYRFTAKLAGYSDENDSNDSTFQIILNLPEITPPYFEDWSDGQPNGWFTNNIVGGTETFVLGAVNKQGVNGGLDDGFAWTTSSLTGNYGNSKTYDLQSPCFNLSGLARVRGGRLSFDYVINTEQQIDGIQVQYSVNDGRSWVTIVSPSNDLGNWYPGTVASFTEEANQRLVTSPLGFSGGFTRRSASIVLPSETWTGATRFRFLFASSQTVNQAGFTMDNFRIQGFPDQNVSVVALTNIRNECGVAGQVRVGAAVANIGSAATTPFKLYLKINNALVDSISFTRSIAAAQIDSILFPANYNFALLQPYSIEVYSVWALDADQSNDTLRSIFYPSATINTLPYSESFENGTGGWSVAQGSRGSTWVWGTAAQKTSIGAARGTRAWYTGLSNVAVANNTVTRLLSPCINMQGSPRIELSFSIRGTGDVSGSGDQQLDGVVLEYTTNQGITWQVVGPRNQGTNWWSSPPAIDDPRISSGSMKPGWGGSIATWRRASINFCVPQGIVQFRYTFTTDALGNANGGFGLDSFVIKPAARVDLALRRIISPNAIGCYASANTPVVIRVVNLGNTSLSNIPVRVNVIGRAQIFDAVIPGPINTCDSADVTLTGGVINMSQIGTYNVRVRLNVPGDSVNGNDSLQIVARRWPDTITGRPFAQLVPNGWVLRRGENVPDERLTTSSWAATTAQQNTRLRVATNGYRVNIQFPNNTAREWLITQPVVVNPASTLKFRVAKWRAGTVTNLDFDDSLAVVVSPDCGNNWYRVAQFGDDELRDTLTSHIVRVGQFGTSAVRVGFYVTSGFSPGLPTPTYNYNYDLIVADVSYDPGPAKDVEILRFVTPTASCGLANETPIEVEIRNRGYRKIGDIRMRVQVDNRPAITAVVSDSLEAFETRVVRFLPAEYFGGGNTFRIRAWASVEGDTVHFNDTLSLRTTRYSTPIDPIGFTPLGERAVNLPAIYPGWNVFSGLNANLPRNNFWNRGQRVSRTLTYRLGNRGDFGWLVSPEINLGPATTISFDMAATDTAGSSPINLAVTQLIEVLASTNCGATWDYTIGTIDRSTGLRTNIRNFSYSLTELSNRPVRFAFRFNDGLTNRLPVDAIIYLDNIQIFNDVQFDAGAISFVGMPNCITAPNVRVPVSLKVRNTGSRSFTEADIRVDVSDRTGAVVRSYTATTGLIDVDGEEDITLGDYLTTDGLQLAFFGSIRVPGDGNPTNDQVRAFVYPCDTTLVPVKPSLAESLRLYPNPNSGKFSISLGDEAASNVKVYILDATGKEVMQTEYSSVAASETLSIDLGQVAAGMYSVQIVTGDQVATKRISVRH